MKLRGSKLSFTRLRLPRALRRALAKAKHRVRKSERVERKKNARTWREGIEK